MEPKQLEQHQWLMQLVGEWTYECETIFERGKPPERTTGAESVRSIGGFWVLCEGRMEYQGGEAVSFMTLGYDPQQQRFVGTFLASMMTYLWLYSGSLDRERQTLTLDAEGPSFTTAGEMAKYQDIITIGNEGQRNLSSRMLKADGTWNRFMTTTYSRKE